MKRDLHPNPNLSGWSNRLRSTTTIISFDACENLKKKKKEKKKKKKRKKLKSSFRVHFSHFTRFYGFFATGFARMLGQT